MSEYSWMSEGERATTEAIKSLAAGWLEQHFGERCTEFNPLCVCCRRWQAYDQLFADVSLPTESEDEEASEG